MAWAVILLGLGEWLRYHGYGKTQPPALYPGMMVIDLMENNAEGEALWKIETARRFPNAVLVFCHGTEVKGQWVMCPQDGNIPQPVEVLAGQLHAEFASRPVVLICCNPGHFKLHVSGVYHALDSVWMRPDKAGNLGSFIPQFVGNIFEFTDE